MNKEMIIEELEKLMNENTNYSNDDYLDGVVDGILLSIQKIEELSSI